MKTLQQHEQFEMSVLDEMRKTRVLDHLIFGGGTMLRLCFDLPRYSVDLDFYLKKDRKSFLPWAEKMMARFDEMGAQITDRHEKHYSFLWEIRMPSYPRRLKIEIRKETKLDRISKTEITIAHSVFSPLQVRLTALTLEQMWWNKAAAMADRNEIRDAFDLEFLTRRQAGRFEDLDLKTLKTLLGRIDGYTEQDYKAKLGGLLEEDERKVILSNRFAYLRSKIQAVET